MYPTGKATALKFHVNPNSSPHARQGGNRKSASLRLGGFLAVTAIAGGLLALSFWPQARQAPDPVDLEKALSELEGEPFDTVRQSESVSAQEPAIRIGGTSATSLRRVEVSSGDTLMDLLVKAGLSRNESHKAITALSDVYDPRGLRPGQRIYLTMRENPEIDGVAGSGESDAEESARNGTVAPRLLRLAIRPNLESNVEVERRGKTNGFAAKTLVRPLSQSLVLSRGMIQSSLAAAGHGEGVPAGVLVEVIRSFSFDVDFQREIRRGDSFEFFYETYRDPEGRLAKTGEILYASLTLSGEEISYYFFEDGKGPGDYYDANGQSVRKALLRTPVDGARISSGFGKRRHPISGYTKLHKGVDFAAPSGTPIFAAGKGKVEFAGRNGGYGNYVRIRHNSSYKTAYAHMRGFAKGVRSGTWVRQGQVIGYVGSTGRSTGPHLHYEIHRNGRQVNPLSLRLPSGEKLKGERLERFQKHRDEIDALRESASSPQIATSQ